MSVCLQAGALGKRRRPSEPKAGGVAKKPAAQALVRSEPAEEPEEDEEEDGEKGAEKRPPAGDDDWVLNVDDFLVELRSQLQQRGLAMNSSDMLRHARRALRQGRWASGLAELIASIVDEERGLPRERGEIYQSD